MGVRSSAAEAHTKTATLPNGQEVDQVIERVVVENLGCFAALDVSLADRLSVIVGANESGKSTLLTAIELGMTGRVGNRWFRDVLTSDWFHRPAVEAYFGALDVGDAVTPPELRVEVHLKDDGATFERLRGVHNRDGVDALGLSLLVVPSDDFGEEFSNYLKVEERPDVLPVEYYDIQWRSFADEPMSRRPKGLSHVLIDASTIRGRRGVDQHTQQLLDDLISPAEHATVSVADRLARRQATGEVLANANGRIAAAPAPMPGQDLSLGIAAGAAGSWRRTVSPMVDGVPLHMSGQGTVAATKVALAVMGQEAGEGSHVLVEEPENHLSHTRLTALIGRLDELALDRQVIVTTHSSFVSNRLGLDHVMLLNRDATTGFSDLADDTVRYFRALSGFDTLRLVLADRVILVEGPSDEIVFSRFYRDTTGRSPLEDGVDVISLDGLAFRRCLELAVAIDTEVVVVRDNDGKSEDELREAYAGLLDDRRRLIVGDPALGHTLEPQIISVNDEAVLREVLGITAQANVATWMSNNKTDAALRIHDAETELQIPAYLRDAVDLVSP